MLKQGLEKIGSRLILIFIVLTCLQSSLPPGRMKGLPLFPPLTKVFSDNPIDAYGNRFSGAKTFVKGERALGYIDESTRDLLYSDGARITPYYLAQYAFAPVALEINSMTHRYILGNFKDGFNFREAASRRGLKIVHDYKNGVVLFMKDSE